MFLLAPHHPRPAQMPDAELFGHAVYRYCAVAIRQIYRIINVRVGSVHTFRGWPRTIGVGGRVVRACLINARTINTVYILL